jgi:hypothetical protein
MSILELIQWHDEQRAELEREQDGEHWAEFHREAVEILSNLPLDFQLTEKGKRETK